MEQDGVHPKVLDAVRRVKQQAQLQEQQQVHQQRRLFITDAENVNHPSVQYLVDFLRGDSHVSELELRDVCLSVPSDGSVGILRDYIANDSKLTKVELAYCDFGSAADTSQLLSAFNNKFLTDFTLNRIRNLEGAALGECLSALLENNTVLQTLTLDLSLDAEASRALQLGLSGNRNLKTLCLSCYTLADDTIRPIANALAELTTLEKLDISAHDITYNSLVSATTTLVELTRLKDIKIGYLRSIFYAPHSDKFAVRRLLHALYQNTSLERLHGQALFSFPEEHESVTMRINNILSRNRSMSRAKALLQLQRRTRAPIASKSGIWYMAMARLTPQEFGVSAVFHILQTRPALLERQLQQPQPAPSQLAETASRGQVAMEREQKVCAANGDDDNSNNQSDSVVHVATSDDGRKRARLS